jgi:hypothetical protein
MKTQKNSQQKLAKVKTQSQQQQPMARYRFLRSKESNALRMKVQFWFEDDGMMIPVIFPVAKLKISTSSTHLPFFFL